MANYGKSDALSGDQSPLQKDRKICHCIEKGPTRRSALIFFEKVRGLSAYFRDSGAATARSTVMPTMGELCKVQRVKSRNLPVAGCRYAHGRKISRLVRAGI